MVEYFALRGTLGKLQGFLELVEQKANPLMTSGINANRAVGRVPANKHDHFRIKNGTNC